MSRTRGRKKARKERKKEMVFKGSQENGEIKTKIIKKNLFLLRETNKNEEKEKKLGRKVKMKEIFW